MDFLFAYMRGTLCDFNAFMIHPGWSSFDQLCAHGRGMKATVWRLDPRETKVGQAMVKC